MLNATLYMPVSAQQADTNFSLLGVALKLAYNRYRHATEHISEIAFSLE